MFNAVTESFFQKKTCVLPGIGSLRLTHQSSQSDFPEHRIWPPRPEIVFTPQSALSKVSTSAEFTGLSEQIRRHVREAGELSIDGLGIFYAAGDEDIRFAPLQLEESFFPSVTAERIIRPDAEHDIVVGDRQLNTRTMAQMLGLSVPDTESRSWIWWAVGLFLLSLGAIIVYFVSGGTQMLGNMGWNG
jgi:hypothetical protein